MPRARHAGRLAILLASFAVLAAPALSAPAPFPDTAAGRLARAFVEAFNAGEDAMRAFTERSHSAADLERTPIERRMAMHRSAMREVGRFDVLETLESSEHRVTLLTKTATGERLALTIECDPANPGHLAGVMLDDAAERDEAPATGATPMTREALRDSVNALVDRLVAAEVFSGVVHLVRGDEVVYSRAAGSAERRFDVPVTLDTKFNVGSIVKFWTRIAIAKLASEGKLSPADRVSRHLPDYPKAVADRITIQQLCNHTSGLGDFFGPRYDAMDRSQLRSVSDYLALFKDEPLRFEPGTDQFYSNAGYALLGAIIEAVSGMPYDSYVRRHVFEPAGMTATGSLVADRPTAKLATGYTRRPLAHDVRGSAQGRDWELRANTQRLPGVSSPAGGAYSTAEDLVRLAHAFGSDRLLAPVWSRWVLGGPVPKKGETKAPPHPPGAAFGIAGGAEGINALIEISLDPQATLVVLANMDPPVAESMGRTIRGWMKRAGVLEAAEVARTKSRR